MTALARRREEALARFAEAGLPTPRQEAWKYTNLVGLKHFGFARTEPAPALDVAPALLPDGRHRIVFANGVFRPELSRMEGPLATLVEAREDEIGAVAEREASPLVALNEGLARDGYLLRLPAGLVVAEPIEVIHVMTGGAAHLRNLIVAGRGAQATIVERHVGLGEAESATNAVTELDLGPEAEIRIWKLQEESAGAHHLAFTAARLATNARFESAILTLGARLSRNETHVRLDGRGAACRLDGAYALRDRQHCDNTTVVTHAAPGCASRQTFKGALDDRARGVFQGKVWVAQEAQKTDAHQLSRALLLSDRAEIDAKPELHIYADDVKCSHGATAGELDEDALFYLRARGVPEAEARGLLVEAFLNDAFEGVANEIVRDAFAARIAAWVRP
jgi:Fe-S cluster assembly protein SufD